MPAEHLLVLAPNWIGDAVMCTPALRALRRTFPQARITLAARQGVCDVLDGLPHVDRFVPIAKRPRAGALFNLSRALKPFAGDVAVVFPHSPRAALLAWLCRSRIRIGLNVSMRGPLLTDRVSPHYENGKRTPRYTALEYLDVVRALGCETDDQGLELRADPDHMNAVHALLPPGGPVVGIAPGAAWSSKRWLPERFAAVADTLSERLGARCVLLTGPGEEAVRAALLGAAKHPLVECHLAAPSMARTKASIARCDLMICNDSGPRHIAIAFGKPVVCIMGSTSPRYTESPWERGKVLRVDVDCGPCQRPLCSTDHRCMTRIGVEAVVNAAEALLPPR